MRGLASRKLAVEVLLKVERDGAFANTALSAAFKNNSLTERDRAFVTYIVQGTLRHQMELDEEIGKLSKKPLARLTPSLRAVLRSAFFQLLHLADMPASAVINTAVEIARKTGHEGSAKFVNGILRNFQRNRPQNEIAPGDSEFSGEAFLDDSFPDEALSGEALSGEASSGEASSAEVSSPFTHTDVQGDKNTHSHPSQNREGRSDGHEPIHLAKKYSLPLWIVERWMKRFGEAECLRLLEHTQQIPLLTLRTCESGISPEGLIAIFEKAGMQVRQSDLVPACIQVIKRGNSSGPLNKLPGYSEGLFAVQDDASALVSIVVAPQVGQTIADLCAAPGGKSVHLGEIMENKGRVIAIDSSEKRLSLLASERRRLGLANIETVVCDGRTYQLEKACDAVLIDAPCSGTGVMNRRADMRQNRKEAQISSLVQTQRELLENGAKMLKPGGILVYSTCSIEPEENEDNLTWFLQEHPEFKPESLQSYFTPALLESWAKETHWDETRKQIDNGYIQLLPSRHGSSGFFICKLRREG